MKFLKSAAIRATALLLFFAMIAAVVLYQAGVYDIAFIQRPVVTLPEEEHNAPGTIEDPGTTLPHETDPNDTTSGEIIDPKPPVDLNEILSLSQAIELGYTLSSARFNGNSILARLEYDFGESASVFSLRTEKVTSTVFYKKESGLIATQKVTTEVDKPRIGLYFGLILIDNGKTVDIYNNSGKQLVKNFSGKLTGALSANGKPVVEIKSKYYEIDSEKGLSSAISKNKVNFKALAFDHPRDYGVNPFDLYPYSDYVNIYTEVKLEEETTTPEATTDTEPTTEPISSEEPEDVVSDTSEEETESAETTESQNDSDETSSESNAEEEPALANEILPDGNDDESTDDTSETEEDEPSDSRSDDDSETPPPSDNDEQTSAKPLPDGVVEIDGKYYTVTKKLMWGYQNAAGETVIKPQYASANAFSGEGLAAVTDFDGSVFYINTKGKEIISIRNKVYIYPEEMSHVRIRQFYFEPVTNGIENLGTYYFDEGFTMVRYCWVSNFNTKQLYRNEFLLIDEKGDVFEIPGGYSLKGYSDGILLLEKDGRYGYMDTNGAWVSPAVYQEAHPFLQGLGVAVNEDGKYGLLDRAGNEVLPFVFDHLSNVSDGKIAAFSEERGWEIYVVADR